MTFRKIRNALVERLWNYMGCPVVLADQVQPEAQLPYGIYSVSTPYAPDRGMGDYTTREAEGGNAEITRMEMPSATFSFTFCSQNRTDADGKYIYGSDEAEDLADKAIGYFQHVGYDDFLMLGITIVEIGQAQNRSTLIIDEAARRVGFDVRIRYTRQDTRVVSSVETAPITEKE